LKKWTLLFQMLANVAVSCACALLLMFTILVVFKPRGIWLEVAKNGVLLVLLLVFWSIRKYHQKKNAQTRT
jgi:Flp pilus assembly protein TadB